MISDYYVYQLRLENSESPFYIGKGRGRRISEHFHPSSLDKKSHKNHTIKKALREGIRVLTEIIHSGLSESEAHVEETKLKMSDARRGQSKSAEHAEAIMFAHWRRNPAWSMADVIYDAWIENGKPGRPTMKKLFPNLGIEKIVKKITNGWNPVINESWLKYASKESKNVGI